VAFSDIYILQCILIVSYDHSALGPVFLFRLPQQFVRMPSIIAFSCHISETVMDVL